LVGFVSFARQGECDASSARPRGFMRIFQNMKEGKGIVTEWSHFLRSVV